MTVAVVAKTNVLKDVTCDQKEADNELKKRTGALSKIWKIEIMRYLVFKKKSYQPFTVNIYLKRFFYKINVYNKYSKQLSFI